MRRPASSRIQGTRQRVRPDRPRAARASATSVLVGELVLGRGRAGGAAHASPRARCRATSRPIAVAHAPTSRGSTTKPVSPSTTASCDPPLRPATAGHRTRPLRGTRCRTLRLRGHPNDRGTTSRTRRHTRTAQADRRRHPAEERGRARGRSARRSRRLRSRPAPPIASCTPSSAVRPRRSRRRSPCGARAARGRAPAVAQDRGRSGAGRGTRRRRATGWNRSMSTPGGTIDAAQRSPGRAHRCPRPDTSPAATTPAAPRNTRRASGRLPRNAPVAGDLGAVRDDDVRRGLQLRTEQPERDHRIEEDDVGAHFARERVDAPRERGRRQQHPLSRALDAERLLARPTRPRRRTASSGPSSPPAAGGATARTGTTGCRRAWAGSRW